MDFDYRQRLPVRSLKRSVSALLRTPLARTQIQIAHATAVAPLIASRGRRHVLWRCCLVFALERYLDAEDLAKPIRFSLARPNLHVSFRPGRDDETDRGPGRFAPNVLYQLAVSAVEAVGYL